MTAVLLKRIGGQATCRSCKAPITWAMTIEGRSTPLERDALISTCGDEFVVDSSETHWPNCKQAQQHRDGAELTRLRQENRLLKLNLKSKDAELARLREQLERRHGDG